MNLFLLLSALRPVALAVRRAAAADRHALRSRSSSAASMRSTMPATRMPASSWSATPSGVTLAPEGGAHQSIAHAADRHGAGRAGRLRAGLRRRAGRHHALGLRLHAARRRGRAVGADLAARRDRRLGLSAPVDAAGRAADAQDRRRRSRATSSTAPTGCGRPGRTPRSSSPITGAVAPRGDRGRRADGRGPPRRRPAGGHLGRPAQCRLDGGGAGARARPAARAQPHRAAARRPAARIAGWSPSSTATRRRWPGSGAVAGHRVRSLGVEHFGQTGTIADLYRALRHRRARRSLRRPRRSRPAGRSAT